MPIQLTCSCGKRLQVGDQYAGRRVSCPGCKTVLTVPGTAVPAATPPKQAPLPAVPPPPAPLPPEPAPAGDPFSFGSGSKDSDEEEDVPKPAGKPGIVGSVGGKGAKAKDEPKSKKHDRDDDDDAPPKKAARGRPGEPKPPSAKAWKGFGTGSALAKWGMWIEFVGATAGTVLVVYLLLAAVEQPGGFATKLDDFGGPLIFLPWFLSSLFGTLLVWLGRARMMGIPSGTGAKKVFLGAFLFTLIRFFAVVGAAILGVVAVTEWKSDPPTAVARAVMGMLVWAVGVPFWLLADLSTIPAMAIVGGALPSRPLRRKAGWVAFAMQLVVIGYVVLALLLYFGSDRIDLSELRSRETPAAARPVPGGRAGMTTTTRPTPTSSVGEKTKTVLMAGAAISVLLHLVYTALYASLYSAGARAAREAREAEEAAEDEDI